MGLEEILQVFMKTFYGNKMHRNGNALNYQNYQNTQNARNYQNHKLNSIMLIKETMMSS